MSSPLAFDHDEPLAGGSPLTGRTVLVAFVLFFAVIAAMNAVMIRYALESFGGVEVGSAYKAGLAFEGDVAAARAQAGRGWSVDLAVDRDGGLVTVVAKAADGEALAGLAGTVVFRHPADRRRDASVALTQVEPGIWRGPLPAEHGQRIADLSLAEDGTVVFRSENRVLLP